MKDFLVQYQEDLLNVWIKQEVKTNTKMYKYNVLYLGQNGQCCETGKHLCLFLVQYSIKWVVER